MAIIIEDSDIVSAIYDGPFEQPLWSTFLDRLRSALRADYAAIIFRAQDAGSQRPVELVSGKRVAPALRAMWEDELHRSDPRSQAQLRDGRVYDLAELLDRVDRPGASSARELFAASGIGHLRMVRLTEPSGVSAGIYCTRERGEFSSAESALLSKVAPHLRRALRSHIALEREKNRFSIASEVVERLNFGWIALNSQGCVVETSPEAARVLQHGRGLKTARNGRLLAVDTAADRRLAAAIRLLAGPSDGSAGARTQAINVSQDPWMELLLTRAHRDGQLLSGAPAVIAYLQGDSRSDADRHEQIAQLFGLLPSEARLALALSRGLSIAEAAQALGLTIETARNYSKKIYAKTGTRGQSDLVRLILTSVLALA
jgi:DNA-binding CsgD family transcriptional regulator